MGKFGVLRKVGTTILVGAGTFAAKKAGELAADKVRKRFTQEENMCPSCHAPGQTGSFCSNCGNSLTGAPAPIVPAPAPITPPIAHAVPQVDPTVQALLIQMQQQTQEIQRLSQEAAAARIAEVEARAQAAPPAPVVPTTPPTAHKKPGFWHQLKQGLDKIDETTGFKKSH